MRKTFLALAGAFLLAGCAAAPGGDLGALRAAADADRSAAQALADRVIEVPDQYRPLRVCLFAAMAVELGVDRVRLFEPAAAAETLGRLMALQGALDRAQAADPMWLNADMADVAFVFARAAFDSAESSLLGYLARGISISAALTAARRIAAKTAKGAAMLRDADAMIEGLLADTITEAAIWAACEGRIARNSATLGVLVGAGLPE